MKKMYAKPNIRIVLMKPVSILQASKEQFQWMKNAGGREADDRFDWGVSDDDDE